MTSTTTAPEKTPARRRPARRAGLLAAAAAAPIALTGAAPAQFGEAAGFGEMMSPYFLRRDLITFETGLDLDDGQATIVESLYWDYEDDHEAGKVLMLDRLSNMREGLGDLPRDQVLKLVFQPFEDRSREWTDARDSFLNNVRAILNTQQLEQWGAFRQELRREKELPRGRFSGESVNLFHVLHRMDLDDRTREMASETLRMYADQLDTALLKREALMQESRLAMMRSIREEDPQSALAIYERQLKARVLVRDTNDDYAIIVTQTLPSDVGITFRQEARERGYPRIYRPTAAQRIFAEAKKLGSHEPWRDPSLALSDEIYQAIEELETAFLGELAIINVALERLIREYEPVEARYRASSFAQRMQGKRDPKPDDPSREEFRRRDELGRRYVELLRGLLTPEQFASLKGAQRFMRRDVGKSAFGQEGDLPGSGKARKKQKAREQRAPNLKGAAGGR